MLAGSVRISYVCLKMPLRIATRLLEHLRPLLVYSRPHLKLRLLQHQLPLLQQLLRLQKSRVS
jgi:hypothetical protein